MCLVDGRGHLQPEGGVVSMPGTAVLLLFLRYVIDLLVTPCPPFSGSKGRAQNNKRPHPRHCGRSGLLDQFSLIIPI